MLSLYCAYGNAYLHSFKDITVGMPYVTLQQSVENASTDPGSVSNCF